MPWFLSSAVLALFCGCASMPDDIRGAWQADTYLLEDGAEHDVEGQIFFAESDWTVLFFVIDDDGEPQRGSAEGGTYTIEGNRLVFTHHQHLSFGNAVPGLPAAPLRMRVADTGDAATELCEIELDGDRLTLHFPSGNAMTFRRSSGF